MLPETWSSWGRRWLRVAVGHRLGQAEGGGSARMETRRKTCAGGGDGKGRFSSGCPQGAVSLLQGRRPGKVEKSHAARMHGRQERLCAQCLTQLISAFSSCLVQVCGFNQFHQSQYFNYCVSTFGLSFREKTWGSSSSEGYLGWGCSLLTETLQPQVILPDIQPHALQLGWGNRTRILGMRILMCLSVS